MAFKKGVELSEKEFLDKLERELYEELKISHNKYICKLSDTFQYDEVNLDQTEFFRLCDIFFQTCEFNSFTDVYIDLRYNISYYIHQTKLYEYKIKRTENNKYLNSYDKDHIIKNINYDFLHVFENNMNWINGVVGDDLRLKDTLTEYIKRHL